MLAGCETMLGNLDLDDKQSENQDEKLVRNNVITSATIGRVCTDLKESDLKRV
jgi:hypothetical protein